MSGAYVGQAPAKVRAILVYLRAAIAYRAAYQSGAAAKAKWPVAPDPPVYTRDPAWLVTMAINRKAGWPDDPSLARGSAMPVRGRYPKRAEEDCGEYQESERLARRMNGTRLTIRAREVPRRYRARLAHRTTPDGEEVRK